MQIKAFGRVLCDFFKILLEKDTPRLEGIEQEITSLEDEILLDRQKVDYVRRIIVLRKRLMVLRRYYEQLLDVFPTSTAMKTDCSTSGLCAPFAF